MVMRVHKNGHRYARREYSPSSHSPPAKWSSSRTPNDAKTYVTSSSITKTDLFLLSCLLDVCVCVGRWSCRCCVGVSILSILPLPRTFILNTHNLSRSIRSFRSFMETFFLRSFLCGARKRYKCSRTHQMLCFMMASSSSSPPSLAQSTHTHTD